MTRLMPQIQVIVAWAVRRSVVIADSDARLSMDVASESAHGGIGDARNGGMKEQERDNPPPIDESTYGGSAAETGGLYNDTGPTIANVEGDTMSEEEEYGPRPPEAPSS